MSNPTWGALALAIALARADNNAAAQSALAQEAAATINDSVSAELKDASGAALAKLTVRVKDATGAGVAEATSDDAGVLHFPALPAGTYALDAEFIVFAKRSRDLVVTASGPVNAVLVSTRTDNLGTVQVVAHRLNQARQNLSRTSAPTSRTFPQATTRP